MISLKHQGMQAIIGLQSSDVARTSIMSETYDVLRHVEAVEASLSTKDTVF